VVEQPSIRSLLWSGYAIAIILIAFPVADLVTNIWPPRFAELQWRFGAVGLLSGFVLTPILGIVGLMAMAIALGHRRVLRAVAGLDLALAVAGFATLILFALDWLQMRSTVNDDVVHSMDVGSLKAIAKHLLSALTLGWLGAAGWRAGRPGPGVEENRSGTPLVRATGSPPAGLG
jgi:hypothetical protein